MKVIIHTQSGKDVNFEIDENNTVIDLIKLIAESKDLENFNSQDHIKLIHKGKPLTKFKSDLSSYG